MRGKFRLWRAASHSLAAAQHRRVAYGMHFVFIESRLYDEIAGVVEGGY
jgi:hypothetical protein